MNATNDTEQPSLRQRFNAIADRITAASGSMPALLGSVALVVIWALTGPVFNFSDTWQLFINTSTTVITFWMVFVIQNSANRQGKAAQLKLDEIIRVMNDARNEFVALDHATDEVLDAHEQEFKSLAAHHRSLAAQQPSAEVPFTGAAGAPPGAEPATTSLDR